MFKKWKKYLFPILTIVEGEAGGESDSGNQKEPTQNQEDDAKSPGEKKQGDSGSDLEALPEWARKEIKNLRKESATYRNNGKRF